MFFLQQINIHLYVFLHYFICVRKERLTISITKCCPCHTTEILLQRYFIPTTSTHVHFEQEIILSRHVPVFAQDLWMCRPCSYKRRWTTSIEITYWLRILTVEEQSKVAVWVWVTICESVIHSGCFVSLKISSAGDWCWQKSKIQVGTKLSFICWHCIMVIFVVVKGQGLVFVSTKLSNLNLFLNSGGCDMTQDSTCSVCI